MIMPSIGKTKLMRVNTTNTDPVKIIDTPVENVESFNYLGSTVTSTQKKKAVQICTQKKIGKHSISVKLDTGADCKVLSRSIAKKLKKKGIFL